MERTPAMAPVGVVLPARIPAHHVPRLAVVIERLGYRSVWLPEDAWDRGGIATLMAALDHTTTLRVGLGIASAMVRYPAFLAMELATIADLHGDRLDAGIGLGVPGWLDQMGLAPRSQVRALRETVGAVRRLLEGETLTEAGERASYDGVRLTWPPSHRVPVLMGVSGPRLLALSGEVADGTIAAEMASVAYLRWARERIAEGIAARSAPSAVRHRIVAYAWFAIDGDDAAALGSVRPAIAGVLRRESTGPHVSASGLSDEVVTLLERSGDGFETAVPRAWLRRFSVAGDPEHCAEAIRERLDAGADEVVLHPGSFDDLDRFVAELERAARDVLPALGATRTVR
jgi:alkanesulfonate monooxygenase SsuD/methylene tetrahydromethanopterin reductase-like flavin-dependent oxidoreductase (luciferase family)